MSTRNGKIARLPKHIRDELARRIDNGEQGKDLVEWLDALPAVQNVLKEQFGGRPVNEQNLSEWKQGGYREWLRQQETRSLVSNLTEQSDDLDEAADGQEISDCLAGFLGAELARLATTLLEKETEPEKRWQRLCEVHRELSRLRRDDHRAVRTLIKRQNWIRKTDREEEEAHKRAESELIERHCAPLLAQAELAPMAGLFGGGESGLDMAAYILELRKGLPQGSLGRKPLPGLSKPPSLSPNKSESDLIKPNQTKSS
jgi:DNA repair exonuclease SbcCD ATPase subunit